MATASDSGAATYIATSTPVAQARARPVHSSTWPSRYIVWTISGGKPKTSSRCSRSRTLRRGPLTNSSNWSRARTTNQIADQRNIARLPRSRRRAGES